MARSEDNMKLTPEEEAALKKLYEQSKGKHGDRFLTLTKDDRTAKYILERRIAEQGATPAKPGEIEAHGRREYGRADWTVFSDLAGIELKKPLRLPKRPSAALWDALGQFVNLTDDGLDGFRRQYPGFFPDHLYARPVGNDAETLDTQPRLVAWQAWRALLRESWYSSFHPEYVAQLVNIPTVPPGNTRFEVQPVCNAQRAVLAMALESWRARFCPKCGLPFVARKAADKYWPKECFAEQRREKQRASARKRRAKSQKNRRRTTR